MGLPGAMSVTRTGGPDAMTCRNVKLREASTTITNMSSPTIVVRGVLALRFCGNRYLCRSFDACRTGIGVPPLVGIYAKG